MQEVDIEMSTDKPFASKEVGARSLEANVLMELQPHSQPTGILVEGGSLAARWAQPNQKCFKTLKHIYISSAMELDENEALPSPLTAPVCICLFKDVKVWHYLWEILSNHDLEGNINLCELKTELEIDGQLHVCKVTTM